MKKQCTAIGPDHGDRCSYGRVRAPNAQFTVVCQACNGTGEMREVGTGEVMATVTQRDANSANLIAAECNAIRDMLLAKNAAYGDSALDPLRIMSKADPLEQLAVRCDDKLSRLARGDGSGNENDIGDLIGYLILWRVAKKRIEAK